MESSPKTFRDLAVIAAVIIVSTLLLWLPHIFKLQNFYSLNFTEGFATIYRNFDGVNYIVIAKTLYNPSLMAGIPQSLPANYYAAHFPGFAVLIALLSPLLGALKSMLFISVVFSVLSAWIFYALVKEFKLTPHPLMLTIIFSFLPVRWLVVRSIGSPEPMFIFFTITALYFFLKFESTRKYFFILLTSLMASFAQFTRPPGILLFIALAFYIFWQNYKHLLDPKRLFQLIYWYLPLLLIPLTLLGVFALYQSAYSDFFAYFHSGDNIHITFPPFSVFNASQPWVGEIWLEDIFYLLLLGYSAAIIMLKSNNLKVLGFYVLVYVVATTFVAHRDISRYILPASTIALIAFEKFLTSTPFKIAFFITLLGLYLYSQNFILGNTAPISDLSIYN